MTTPEVNPNIVIIAPQPCRTSVILKLENEDDKKGIRRSWGFHLSRSKWDPYPWVGYVEAGSIAELAGLRAGDCLLNIEGIDLVGLRVKEIASLIRKDAGYSVRLEVWRSFRRDDVDNEDGAALAGPLPEVAGKLAKAVSGTVRALECPVCLESATSPVSQCVHGHILCVGCRAKTPRCPVCRVRLGQGRCLLADEVQRYIREAFAENNDDDAASSNDVASLREKLFGKIAKKSRTNGCDNHSRISPAKVKSSLARLLLGGFDKAASAENLSVATLLDEGATSTTTTTSTDGGRPAAYRRLNELSQNDRTKSASTGELSMDNDNAIDPSIYRLGNDRVSISSSGLLSVPQTPRWGGSTESINNSQPFPCPLSRWTSCKEHVSSNFVLEHLDRYHQGAQVHFKGRNATIPLPLPFGPDSSYILHHRGELFFFQYDNETAWIAATGTENLGEWTMRGQNGDGTRVELRRIVSRLDDSSAPISCHLAPLPKALGITRVNVELLDSRLGEGLQV